MRTSFVALAAALVLVALVGVGGLLYARSLMGDVTARWGPLRLENADLLARMVDAETGQRGFTITGDERFLDPYQQSLVQFPKSMSQARQLAGDDAEIVRLFDQQKQIYDEWVQSFGKPAIELRRAGPAGTQAIEANDRGRVLVDRFRAANTAAEKAIADRRSDDVSRILYLTSLAAVIMTAALVAGVWIAFRVSLRVRGELTQPLQELQDTLARLEAGETSARATPRGVIEVQAVTRALNALADENERLAALHRQELTRAESVRDAVRVIRASLDRDEILAAAVAALGNAADADRVVVWPARPDRDPSVPLRRLAVWNSPGVADLSEGVAPPPRVLISGIKDDLAAGRLAVIPDVAAERRIGEEGRAWLQAMGVGAVVVAPIVAGRRMVAVVAVKAVGGPRSWTPPELSLIETMARDVGAALGHADVLEHQRELVNRLQELDEAKSDFVSSVSHELRTPLTSITGYVEMLRDGDAGRLSAEQDEMLAVVERNTERLLNLIEDLLTLSRIESGAFKVTLATVNVGDLVNGALQAVMPRMNDTWIAFDVDVSEQLAPVQADAFQIERVVLNLLSNAMKFTPEHGRVHVGVRQEGDFVLLEVADSGIGIPPEEQGQLFTRFFRASSAQARGVPGTGLGLTITKTIVENHGGTIDVVSALGEGTTFTVRLPVAPACRRELAVRR